MQEQAEEVTRSQSDIDIAAEIESSAIQNSGSLLNYKPDPATNKPVAEVKSRPEYWPEDLWDSEKGAPKLDAAKEKLEKSEQAYKDLRKILSDKKSFEAYKKEEEGKDTSVPEMYEFERVGDDFKGDRQSIESFSNAAREAGLSNSQANTIINKYFDQEEERSIQKRDSEIKKLGDDGEYILQGINNFINTRVNNGTFSSEEAQTVANLITDSTSAMAISKLISMTGEMQIPSRMRMANQSKSREDIKQAMVAAIKAKDQKTLKSLREDLENL